MNSFLIKYVMGKGEARVRRKPESNSGRSRQKTNSSCFTLITLYSDATECQVSFAVLFIAARHWWAKLI